VLIAVAMEGYPYVGLVALTFVSEPTVTFTTTPENSLGEGVISFLPLFANEQGENQFDRDVSWFSLWPVSALACRSMISPRHSHPKFCIALHKARSCEQRGQGVPGELEPHGTLRVCEHVQCLGCARADQAKAVPTCAEIRHYVHGSQD